MWRLVLLVVVAVILQELTRSPRRRRRARSVHRGRSLTAWLETPLWIPAIPESAEVRSGWTMDALHELEWKRFEVLTAEFLKTLGFKAELSRVGADGGVDVRLFQEGQAKPVGIAQCKAWNTYTVGVKPVRELFGVMAAEKVEHGAFVTTSGFTQEARDFAAGKNLELVDGETLLRYIRSLPADQQQRLFNKAFSGDYSTPTCPNCDVKMVLRTAQKSRAPGSQFWGCRNYPRCRQTFKLKE